MQAALVGGIRNSAGRNFSVPLVGKPGKHRHDGDKDEYAALRGKPIAHRPAADNHLQITCKENDAKRRRKPNQQ